MGPTSSIQTDWTDHLTFENSEEDRHQDGRVHELLPQPLRLEGDAHPHPRPRRRWKDHTLYRLQVGEVVTTIPTIGFNVEQVTYKNLKFQVWDLGGQTSIRPYWRCYYSNTDAVIYVVDSADRDRVGISKQELVSMLEEEELKNAILVVLANKQDIEGAMSVTEVHQALGLEALKNRTFQIFKASAVRGDGLDESMEWLSNSLQARK